MRTNRGSTVINAHFTLLRIRDRTIQELALFLIFETVLFKSSYISRLNGMFPNLAKEGRKNLDKPLHHS